MAEHKQGSMDITDQEKTFAAFVKISTYFTIGVIIFLIFLALVGG